MDKDWLAAILTVVTALNLGPAVFKHFRTKSEKIVDRKVQVETTSIEIANMKSVLESIQTNHNDAVTTLKAQNITLTNRVGKLEERERHMLTRVAIHEAWDQIAFGLLIQQNPDHPAPPPLHDQADLIAAEKEHLERLERHEPPPT